MYILIIGLNYLPESTSIGPYTAGLAEFLVERGHKVQVITGFPQAPQWQIWDGYRGKCFTREVINKVPVLRTYLYMPRQPRKALQRILFDLSFSFSSLLGGLTASHFDLVIAISPPLQIGLSAWLLGLLRRAPFFIHLQDLVPDAAVAAGILHERTISVRLARAVERFVYQRARGIGVICDGFKRNLISKGVWHEKIVVLPNHVDVVEFSRPFEKENGFREQHGIKPDTFLVMYSGSIALKQGLQVLVEAAAEFSQNAGVVFYLVGEGPYFDELERRAKELQLTNFRFLPLQRREILPLQLSAADALVITQRKAMTDVVFPGKLLHYMASGRPILAAVNPDSETGRFVSNHQVGLVVPPEEPKALARAIRLLQDKPQEADRLGHNGRRVAVERFDRKVVLAQFADYLETLAKDA